MRGFTDDDVLDQDQGLEKYLMDRHNRDEEPPAKLEHEDHTPPADQTVLSDSDLLDKLADWVERGGRVEIVHMPSELTARLTLRKTLARL
jgi:hypothetical protein